MRVPGWPRKEEGREPNGDPKKISQRWVIILLTAAVGWWMAKSAVTEATTGLIVEEMTTAVSVGAQTAGITAALAIVGLLDKIME